MRILVIGGTRFIGPVVVKRLRDADHAVTLFHRKQSHENTPPDILHIHGNRARLADFRDTFAQIAPDVVLDMAPLPKRMHLPCAMYSGGLLVVSLL